jgi:predicted nucleic acid-binding protein
MKRLVLDASVAVKLFFEEEHSDAAEKHVRQAREILAPDLIWVEAANVIWKRQRRGEITKSTAAEVAEHLLKLPLTIHPSAELIGDALDIAMQFERTVYDGLYLALAVRSASVLLSADKRLVNSLSKTPLAEYITWVGSAP